MNQYERLPVVESIEEAEKKLKTAEGEELCLLLLALSEINDWKWVQTIYLGYLSSDDYWVASAAITGLGHLARISKQIDKEHIIEKLIVLGQKNPSLKGKTMDAISDIEIFSQNN